MSTNLGLAPRVGFFGASRSGKTTLLKSCVYQWLDAYSDVRFIVYDHTLEWNEKHDRLFVFPSYGAEIDEVAEIALKMGDVTFVVDELDAHFSSQGGFPRGTPLHAIFNHGRHYNVGAMICARRTLRVPRDATANLSDCFALHCHEPNDIVYMRSILGTERANKLPSLSRGQFIYQKL